LSLRFNRQIAASKDSFGLIGRAADDGLEAIADCFAALMSEVLGYRRFGAQGGDWGSFVTARLGYAYPERLSAIHLNMMPVRRDPTMVSNPTPEESRFLNELKLWLKEETGYQWIQGTRPQTLAFALTDSPAGLAAWIMEKFRAWSDCGGDIEAVFSRDHLLANISLYWFTGAISSSFWPYYARMHGPWPIPAGETVTVSTGYCEFPREMLRPPRSLAERTFTNLQRWSVMERGGHFAAMEQPDTLAQEVRALFRTLR
jgi:microsomal epoxide hydrolase